MTIKKIAKAAGVSTATVSRVLNGSDKVRVDTAEYVMDVVESMNYRLDHVARRMKVKPTESLVFGLVVTDISNPFFANVAKGVEDFAFKSRHVMMMCITNEDPMKEKFFLNSLLSEKVSGVIIVPTSGNRSYFEKLVADGFPIVMVDRVESGLEIDTVSINNELGAYVAVCQLIKNGHRRIGIVNGIKGLSNTESRFEGYKRALRESGIPVERSLVTYGNFVEAGGREAMTKLLSLKTPPTAVFSANNLMTLGCIKMIYQHNLSIPDEIALIGFDDSTWAEALIPPLTTVKQPGYELGYKAAELLIRRLQDTTAERVGIMLEPELIIRASCGTKVVRGRVSPSYYS